MSKASFSKRIWRMIHLFNNQAKAIILYEPRGIWLMLFDNVWYTTCWGGKANAWDSQFETRVFYDVLYPYISIYFLSCSYYLKAGKDKSRNQYSGNVEILWSADKPCFLLLFRVKDPSLWSQALAYFASKEEACKSHIIDVLNRIFSNAISTEPFKQIHEQNFKNSLKRYKSYQLNEQIFE